MGVCGRASRDPPASRDTAHRIAHIIASSSKLALCLHRPMRAMHAAFTLRAACAPQRPACLPPSHRALPRALQPCPDNDFTRSNGRGGPPPLGTGDGVRGWNSPAPVEQRSWAIPRTVHTHTHTPSSRCDTGDCNTSRDISDISETTSDLVFPQMPSRLLRPPSPPRGGRADARVVHVATSQEQSGPTGLVSPDMNA